MIIYGVGMNERMRSNISKGFEVLNVEVLEYTQTNYHNNTSLKFRSSI